MGSEWKELTIEELKAKYKGSIAMGPFGSRIKAENFVREGIPIIKGGNLHGAVLLDKNFDFLTVEKAEELKSSQAFRRDLVITHRGTIGQVSIIPENSKFSKYIVSQSQLKVTLNEDLVDPFFVNYFFQSHIGQHRLLANASQVGVPAIAKASTSVKEILVSIPPLPEQKSIAHILGSLDDKIELNRRMNATLESMAQALFKSWFVDFDPVIDNALVTGNPIPEEFSERAETRRKALIDGTANRETAKQFPASFKLTEELGWIPEGWEVEELGKLAQNIREGVDPKTIPEETPYVGLEHIDKQSFSLSRWGVATDIDSHKSYFSSEDFLFGKLRPYFHKVCQVNSDGICSTDILVIRQRYAEDAGYVGCQIFEPEFVEYANLRSTGTRMPRASWKDMAKYEIACPPQSLRKVFNIQVKHIREKCAKAVAENQTLNKLRDTLLPKLISGELRIPKVEKLVKKILE